ncbi:MAG: 4-hydroxythreonine-4-phosphate dehydrogenase PdxA [Omnitrophica bacterium]|nr:4-hydroxythreonine-4-phosphate dehydrogenase PdxA [Candidatus Omnitrophota bacterium]
MPTSHSDKKLVVITGGDPRGIGPEVILKALRKLPRTKKFIPLVIGDYEVFQNVARALKIDADSLIRPVGRAANFIDLNNFSRPAKKKFRSNNADRLSGKASIEYILRAIVIVKSDRRASIVTAPINKAAINNAGYKWSGHTELFSDITGYKKITMMLTGGPLKVSLATRHLPLGEAVRELSKEKIITAAENTHYALKKFFRIRYPKIGIASLNPHAGESGLLGKEEGRVIRPAVAYLNKRIKGISGPFPADTLFYKAYRKEFDAVVCMYHDQGLIPLKMVAFERGVNLTIGLPFIRTSPDHGTGFDIAGKGTADPSSMIEAIKLAVRLA